MHTRHETNTCQTDWAGQNFPESFYNQPGDTTRGELDSTVRSMSESARMSNSPQGRLQLVDWNRALGSPRSLTGDCPYDLHLKTLRLLECNVDLGNSLTSATRNMLAAIVAARCFGLQTIFVRKFNSTAANVRASRTAAMACHVQKPGTWVACVKINVIPSMSDSGAKVIK